MSLSNKIDFAVVFSVRNANPNGDPLNGNRPRTTYEGYGEVSDVCIKRKIRNRILEDGKHKIFVQSDDNNVDDFSCLKARAESVLTNMQDKKATVEKACKTWFDVRAFGQILPFKGERRGEGVSIPIRGPVSIHSAFSEEPVSCSSIQITKSVSLESGAKKGSDTMGMKHRVDEGIYTFYGSMNTQLAKKTGFSDEDAEVIKNVLPRLFENDASSARPEGSMEVLKVVWWKHDNPSGQISSAKVHQSMTVGRDENGTIDLSFSETNGPKPEVIDGY